MPDRRQHRGPHPEDRRLFSSEQAPALRMAVEHLSWLLSRGYAPASALKLVGDRFSLLERQRTAVLRCSCSDEALHRRERRRVELSALHQAGVAVDGFNLLTTVEAALSGGVLLRGRDGCLRDMASMHGSYRKVQETTPALEAIGRTCAALGVARAEWFLDRPVSNSGRLAAMIRETADQYGWDWRVTLAHDPDPILCHADEIVLSADSWILDSCARWANIIDAVLGGNAIAAWILDLRPAERIAE